MVEVEKERQRLQAELEIAREVQAQLHPKRCQKSGAWRLSASATRRAWCLATTTTTSAWANTSWPSLSAIGREGHFGSAADGHAAIGDAQPVAPLHGDDGQFSEWGDYGSLSTARLMSNLNQHLYASTSPEKYATFFFSIYDDETEMLNYTNAGHLPPLLVRGGEVFPFDVNGTVVGAFPDVPYGELPEARKRRSAGLLHRRHHGAGKRIWEMFERTG